MDQSSRGATSANSIPGVKDAVVNGIKHNAAMPGSSQQGSTPNTQSNGIPSSLPNGISGASNGISNSSGPQEQKNITALLSALPEMPEDGSRDGYRFFGKLVERVTQQSWLDLSDLIDQMANIPISAPAANGNGHSSINAANPQALRNNEQKKLAWLEWANTNREKFIKLMVISQWGRTNGDTIKTLTRMMFWANEQYEDYQQKREYLAQLKGRLHPFRIKNPDITTALEILSTGTDSYMPDVRCSI